MSKTNETGDAIATLRALIANSGPNEVQANIRLAVALHRAGPALVEVAERAGDLYGLSPADITYTRLDRLDAATAALRAVDLSAVGRDEAHAQAVDVEELHGIAIDLAYALRLSVTTEHKRQRNEALERWESYVVALAASLPARTGGEETKEESDGEAPQGSVSGHGHDVSEGVPGAERRQSRAVVPGVREVPAQVAGGDRGGDRRVEVAPPSPERDGPDDDDGGSGAKPEPDADPGLAPMCVLCGHSRIVHVLGGPCSGAPDLSLCQVRCKGFVSPKPKPPEPAAKGDGAKCHEECGNHGAHCMRPGCSGHDDPLPGDAPAAGEQRW